MGKFLGVSAVACLCVIAAGCASAPISIAGSALPGSAAESQTQHSLRGATSRMQMVFEERGWIRAAHTMGDTTRNWMARLTGQDVEETAPVADEPVPYLMHTNFSTMDSAVAIARLTTDIDEAQDLVRDVDLAAAHLIGRDEGISRASITRDLELVERAVAHSREAIETFDVAISTVSQTADSEAVAQLHQHRSLLVAHSEHLRDRADEIARIRHDMRSTAAS